VGTRGALIWSALGTVAGWACVELVIRPGVPGPAEVAPACAVALLAPVAGRRNPARAAANLAAGGMGLAFGWAAASYARLGEPDRATPRVAPRESTAPRRLCIVYFTHGEPETYQPEPWVRMLHELDATVPGFPPKPVWPFILAGVKRSFRAVGTSPHGRIHSETMAAVRRAVDRPDVEWRLAFLDAEPSLWDAMAGAARDGATGVVLLTVFLTESDHTAAADDLDGAMGLSEAGIRVVRTPVLWDDPRLARMVAQKVERAAADRDRSTVGVLLVGHGQPEQWDRTHPTETEQEIAFRAAVRDILVAEGFRADLVSDGWMSFRRPRVPERVRELADAGATCVIGVPVTISADSLHSLHDTPELMRRGARRSALEVIDVGGWNTEDLLVGLLADRSREALAQLEGPSAAPS
jgi:protoheme ferro-lyase